MMQPICEYANVSEIPSINGGDIGNCNDLAIPSLIGRSIDNVSLMMQPICEYVSEIPSINGGDIGNHNDPVIPSLCIGRSIDNVSFAMQPTCENSNISEIHSINSGDIGNSNDLAIPPVYDGHTISFISPLVYESCTIDKIPSMYDSQMQYLQLKNALLSSQCWNRDGFLFSGSSTLITFVKLTDCLVPEILISVIIAQDFSAHIRVMNCELSSSHELWNVIPSSFDSIAKIQTLFVVLSSWSVCQAIKESQLTAFSVRRDHAVASTDDTCSSTSLRCQSCSLFIPSGPRCDDCNSFRRCLMMRHFRNKHCAKNIDATKSKRPNAYLSSPLRVSKLQLLARKSRGLDKRVNVLETKLKACRKKCRDVIAQNGAELNDDDSDILTQLAAECKEAALAQFPAGSFQQTLFQQQLKYNSLKRKSSIRWHPAVIRWCLFIKSKSAKAYEGLRSFLSLPSSRTLYDYTHYTEHCTGINPKTVEQLIAKATSLGCYSEADKSYVGILLDEVKIKSNLVYNKTTGELVGYVSLDKVADELQNLEQLSGGDKQLAEHMLVTMVRGITTGLRYPLSAYATKSASASSLYSIMWECVESLETIAGLKVLYICCDGAVQNRKFFNLHAAECNNLPVHKTKNLYATDGREIFFISDPPHLLKTARNCLASSHSKSKTRHLWFDGDMSWGHIMQLFDEHCSINSEFSLCPKLTKNHVKLTSFSKMRVNLAAQVLSATVANALEHVYGENVKCTVDFIRTMNKWFDIMNVKNLFEGQRRRNPDLAPFTNSADERLVWLENDFLEYLKAWKDAVNNRPGPYSLKDRKCMQLSDQTITGLTITSRSMVAIVRLLLDSGAKFVLTSHINQDPLEQFFGHCRHKAGSNDNPNVAEACHIINTIRTISTQAVANVRGNTSATCQYVIDATPVPKRCAKK
jgi:hypothetical protein